MLPWQQFNWLSQIQGQLYSQQATRATPPPPQGKQAINLSTEPEVPFLFTRLHHRSFLGQQPSCGEGCIAKVLSKGKQRPAPGLPSLLFKFCLALPQRERYLQKHVDNNLAKKQES